MSQYKLISKPALWMSAHRKNEFKIRLPQSLITSGFNAGGYLKINLSGSFLTPLAVGDRVYIPNLSPYTGFHTVREVHSAVQVTLNTAYQSTISGSVVIWKVELPTIQIYKGYKLAELTVAYDGGTYDFYTNQPYELVAEFKPEAGADGYLTFDISGYLKTVIDNPYKPAYSPDEDSKLYPVSALGVKVYEYTPLYYNKVTVCLPDSTGTIKGIISSHYAANAAISTDELNRFFVDTERPISVMKQPVKLFDSFSIADYININILKAKYNY